MTISEGLPRFDNERALLITTGKQVGKLYYATKGRVHEIDHLELETPKYSDREGFFARSGSGRAYGAGAPYEPKDTETKRKFLRQFGVRIKEAVAKRKTDAIYLFTPNYAIKELKEELSGELRDKIRFSFMGNYVKFGPEDLLSKIQARLDGRKDKNQALKPAEAKIMQKPRSTPQKAGRQAKKTRRFP